MAENSCKFCPNPGKYTCPRCDLAYCSQPCYDAPQHAQCSETFYKNWVTQELSGNSASRESTDKMLTMLKKLQSDEDESELDSDDEGETATLEERLRDVNLEDTATVWQKLTKDEQQEFDALVRSGEIAKLCEIWTPWWCNKVSDTDYPTIKNNIKPLETLTSQKPSHCVKHNLANILTGYVFTVRYFNGDHFSFAREACATIVTISLNLTGKNFASYAESSKSVLDECVKVGLTQNLPDCIKQEDVSEILERKQLILSALSDLYNLFEAALKAPAKNSQLFVNNKYIVDLSTKQIKLCMRKLEYLLAFVNE